MAPSVRRVVTGLDEQGRSCVLFDDRQPGENPRVLWKSAIPADNGGRDDAGGRDFTLDMFGERGGVFMFYELQPGAPAFLHATDTLDYVVVLKGRIELQLEAGTVELSAGDTLVNRGVVHGWRALGGQSAQTLSVLIPAHPVGGGATL